MGQGNKKITITKNVRYVVLDKTAQGYKIEYNVADMVVDGDKDIADQVQVAGNKYLKGAKMILQTNTDGKVEKILNLDEVAAAGMLSQTSRNNIRKTLRWNRFCLKQSL